MATDDRTRTEKVVDHLKGRLNLKTVAKEILDTVTDKIVPQGAAELAQAINTQGVGYVPYGPGQEPTKAQTGVHGPEAVEQTQELAAPDQTAEPPPQISARDRLLAKSQTYQAVSVDEIGPPQATPSIKGQSVKSQQRDPLDQARETAKEAAKGQGKSKEKQIDIG